MKKNYSKLLLLFALGAMTILGFSSCSSDDNSTDATSLTSNEKEMKAAATQYASSTVQATYAPLSIKTGDLYDELKALRNKFVANPSSITQSDIDKVCETFKDARSCYELSEAFLFGAATDFGIDPHIDTWPLDANGLAASLTNKTQLSNLSTNNEDDNIAYAAGKLGQELLGFHGIEFILFRNGANRTVASLQANETDAAFKAINAQVSGKEELYYATAVAGDLRDRCWQLEYAWNENAPATHKARIESVELPFIVNGGNNSYAQNLLKATQAGSTYKTWQEVISTILVSGCQNISNEVANTKIGNPYSGQNVNYIESPYSHRTFIDFKDNILSIQYSLYGGYGLASPSSTSIMAYIQRHNTAMATQLDNDLKSAVTALETCQNTLGSFVNHINDQLVGKAQKAVQALDADFTAAGNWFSTQK
jgi:hypothetical protein